MNRYKFTDASIKKAIKYIKGAKTGPTWAKKFKDDLSVKSGKVFYKGMQVVPKERVDDVLRKEIYQPNGDVPSGRDAAFHICKQRYIGISRRALMKFIRAQKPLGQVKAALPKPKRSAGERLKNYTFETDLVFLKKNDLSLEIFGLMLRFFRFRLIVGRCGMEMCQVRKLDSQQQHQGHGIKAGLPK